VLGTSLRAFKNSPAVVAGETGITKATAEICVTNALMETILGTRLSMARLAAMSFPSKVAEALAELAAPMPIAIAWTHEGTLRELTAILASKTSNAHA
jgi:hypothetical protein